MEQVPSEFSDWKSNHATVSEKGLAKAEERGFTCSSSLLSTFWITESFQQKMNEGHFLLA